MSGPYKYHSQDIYKASHSTRECIMNDKLAKEKNSKSAEDTDGDDEEAHASVLWLKKLLAWC